MTGLGQRICNARKTLGMTQSELAAKVGLTSKTTICKIEKGDDNLTTETIAKYAKALNVSIAYLIGLEETETITFEVTPEEQDRINKALKMYETYTNLLPELQDAVDALLKSHK